MFQDVEQIAALDVENDVLELDAALRPELRVLRVRVEVNVAGIVNFRPVLAE